MVNKKIIIGQETIQEYQVLKNYFPNQQLTPFQVTEFGIKEELKECGKCGKKSKDVKFYEIVGDFCCLDCIKYKIGGELLNYNYQTFCNSTIFQNQDHFYVLKNNQVWEIVKNSEGDWEYKDQFQSHQEIPYQQQNLNFSSSTTLQPQHQPQIYPPTLSHNLQPNYPTPYQSNDPNIYPQYLPQSTSNYGNLTQTPNYSEIDNLTNSVSNINLQSQTVYYNTWESLNLPLLLVQQWANHCFNPIQVREWLNIGIQPNEVEFCVWLRDVKGVDSYWVLNNGNVQQLRQEFSQWQQQQYQNQQLYYPPNYGYRE